MLFTDNLAHKTRVIDKFFDFPSEKASDNA